MQRYFITNEQIQGNKIRISSEDAHHIKNVMRRKTGDTVYCVLSPNQLLETKIVSYDADKSIVVEIIDQIEETHELPVTVTVAQGLPKGEKVDWVLQKGTELGMTHYVPLQMERSIVKLDPKKEQKRLERWHKIVKEAAEQSYRNALPNISPVQSLKEFVIAFEDYDYKLIAYEETAKSNPSQGALKKIMKEIQPNQRIVMVFGPEGGISEKEIEILQAVGYIPCALGPRILRTETAPLYFLSALSYMLE